MGWIFLAALEESHSGSETTCDQSPIEKSIDIVEEYCFLEWFLVYCPKHPFGMILKTYGFNHLQV